MAASIRTLIGVHLDDARLEASPEIMGSIPASSTTVPTSSSRRGTDCGLWRLELSRHAFGGDHSAGRDTRLLDPAADPARIRAIAPLPGLRQARIGPGAVRVRAAAAREGFRSLELVRPSWRALYLACGFSVMERLRCRRRGVTVPCARMIKAIPAARPG
jgi:hypothetical protein